MATISKYHDLHVWKCFKKPIFELHYHTAHVWRWEDTLVGVRSVFWPRGFQDLNSVGKSHNLQSLAGTRKSLFHTLTKNLNIPLLFDYLFTHYYLVWILTKSCVYRDIWRSRQNVHQMKWYGFHQLQVAMWRRVGAQLQHYSFAMWHRREPSKQTRALFFAPYLAYRQL